MRRTKKALLTHCGGRRATQRLGTTPWRRRRLLILCYHGISIDHEHEWRPKLYFTTDQLRERFEILRDAGAHVLPLGEAVERMRAGDLPPRAVALTFDDGGYDFLARAVPVLQAFGFPATVYLSTYYCVNPVPLFPLTASFLLWTARDRALAMEPVTGSPRRFDLRDPEAREAAHAHMLAEASDRGMRDADKQRMLRRLATALDVDYDAVLDARILQLMRPDEVRAVSEAGFDVQLHTHRHHSPVDEALYRAEIRENRDIVEGLAGGPARHFCYPSGVYRAEFVEWLAAEGVHTATTCEPGLASVDDHDLLLPRLVDHAGLSAGEFESWIHGLGHLCARRRPRLIVPAPGTVRADDTPASPGLEDLPADEGPRLTEVAS